MLFQSFALDVMFKATILLVAVGGIDWMLRRTSAAMRHRLWATCFFALLLLPLLSVSMPHWRLPILPAEWALTQSESKQSSEETESQTRSGTNGTSGRRVARPSTSQASVDFRLEVPKQQVGEASTPLVRAVDRADELISNSAQMSQPSTDKPAWSATVDFWFLSSWLVGAVAAIAPLCIGIVKNARMERMAESVEEKHAQSLVFELCTRLGIRRRVTLLKTNRAVVPMTWGIRSPVVLIPAAFSSWLPASRRLVLLHELAHVKRYDVVYQTVARLACSVFWFHPLAWYALRRLRIERELACDDCVLMAGEKPSSYAQQLLEIARRYQCEALPPAVAMAHRSGLEQRVRALLDRARSHLPLSRNTARLLLVSAVASATLLATIRLEAVADLPTFEPSTPDAQGETMTIVGVVSDEQGMPIAGAEVKAVRLFHSNTYWNYSSEELTGTKTDDTGRYSMRVPVESDRFSNGRQFETQTTHILANHESTGPSEVAVAMSSTDLILKADDVAVVGRIVDLEGQPIAGVRVQVNEIADSAMDLDEWIASAQHNPASATEEMRMSYSFNKGKGIRYFAGHQEVRAVLAAGIKPVKTDENGDFRISGIGRDRLATLRIDGAGIAVTLLQVLTRETAAINMPINDPRHRAGKIYGNEFVYSAEPAQLIKGRVTDRLSGEPIAGASVSLVQYADNLLGIDGFLSTQTDANGNYVLNGIPKAPQDSRGTRIAVSPPLDRPYFRSGTRVPKVGGLAPITVNMKLTPGIWIQGQVTSEGTQAPVAGMVAYYPHLENPHAKDHEAFDRGARNMGYDDLIATDQLGRFRIPAMPGRGALRFVAQDDYQFTLQGPSIRQRERADEWNLYHIMMPGNAMVALDIPENTAEFKVSPTVVPMLSQSVRVVGPDGQPLTGYQVGGKYPKGRPTISGRGARFWSQEPATESILKIVVGSKSERARPLMFYHEEKQLGAVFDLNQLELDPDAAIELALKPCARFTGKLTFSGEVTADERSGWLTAGIGEIKSTKFNSMTKDGRLVSSPPQLNLTHTLVGDAEYADDGTFEYIVPAADNLSLYYGGGLHQRKLIEEMKVAPGDVWDFGDVRVDAPDAPLPELKRRKVP